MNRLTNCMASVAFALMLGMSAEAYAAETDVVVRIDNVLNPSEWDNAKGDATLWVCIEVEGVGELCDHKRLQVIASNWDFEFDDVQAFITAVTHIRLLYTTPGDTNDLLVVDQIELWGNGTRYDPIGVDNEEGYCFSAQSTDFSNSHCGTEDTLAGTWNEFVTIYGP